MCTDTSDGTSRGEVETTRGEKRTSKLAAGKDRWSEGCSGPDYDDDDERAFCISHFSFLNTSVHFYIPF